jgi:hypothetical protein
MIQFGRPRQLPIEANELFMVTTEDDAVIWFA